MLDHVIIPEKGYNHEMVKLTKKSEKIYSESCIRWTLGVPPRLQATSITSRLYTRLEKSARDKLCSLLGIT
jgi:hypothetical protein